MRTNHKIIDGEKDFLNRILTAQILGSTSTKWDLMKHTVIQIKQQSREQEKDFYQLQTR